MFWKSGGVRSGLNGFKTVMPVALVVLASAAAVAPAAAVSGPWDHGDRAGRDRWDRGHREVYVRRGPAVVIEARPRIIVTRPVVVAQPTVVVTSPADVVPADLRFAAYQTRDAILVLISGSNAGSGYTTTLTSVDCEQWTPTLQMRNCPPSAEVVGGVSTPFSLSAAIHVAHSVSSLNIVVAGQSYLVPVMQVDSLS